MSDIPTDPAPQSGIDVGALAHAIAGIAAVVLGGLMYTRPWAQDLFAILMLVAAVSAVYFSSRHSAWVPGHWLAMVPVTGVVLGYLGWQWGFTLAYLTLWIAFIHFVIRGVQSLRASEAPDAKISGGGSSLWLPCLSRILNRYCPDSTHRLAIQRICSNEPYC